jgi:hypothetical protein
MNIATSAVRRALVLAALASSQLSPEIAFAQGLPDFVVTSLDRGNSLPVNIATICNVGGAAFTPDLVTITLYSDIGGPATYLLYAWWGPGQCETLNLGYCSDVGDYGCQTPQILLIADLNTEQAIAEASYSNNTHFTQFPKPDLIVSSVSATLDQPNYRFNVSGEVCNTGAGWAAFPGVTIQLGESMGWSGPYTLAPYACGAFSATLHVWEPGWYSPIVTVDPDNQSDELNENNNQGIGSAVAWGPDLVALYAGAFPVGNGLYRAWAIVCNWGATESPGANVDFHASLDGAISTSDPWFGSAWYGNLLAAGSCVALFGNDNYFPHAGTWVVGVIVDRWNAVLELAESNNVLAGSSVTATFP